MTAPFCFGLYLGFVDKQNWPPYLLRHLIFLFIQCLHGKLPPGTGCYLMFFQVLENRNKCPSQFPQSPSWCLVLSDPTVQNPKIFSSLKKKITQDRPVAPPRVNLALVCITSPVCFQCVDPALIYARMNVSNQMWTSEARKGLLRRNNSLCSRVSAWQSGRASTKMMTEVKAKPTQGSQTPN